MADEKLASKLREDGMTAAAHAIVAAQPEPPRRIGIGGALAILLAAHDTKTKIIVGVVGGFGATLVCLSPWPPVRSNDWLTLLDGLAFILLVVTIAGFRRYRLLRAIGRGQRHDATVTSIERRYHSPRGYEAIGEFESATVRCALDNGLVWELLLDRPWAWRLDPGYRLEVLVEGDRAFVTHAE